MPKAIALKTDQAPVWREGIFCSSSCGYGCTRAAFERATLEASALAQRMGPGWEPRVWENGGWNYMISKGRTEIRPHRTGNYISGQWTVVDYAAWINLDPPIGSKTWLQFILEAATPEEALSLAVHAARMTAQRINNQITQLLYDGPDVEQASAGNPLVLVLDGEAEPSGEGRA